MNNTQSPAMTATASNNQLRLWLLACAALVFCMIVLGGVTRLTNSGLSIVEWKPVSGILPPFTAEAWDAEFSKYQQYPEFQKVNHRMTLDEFKGIFWLEYWHRVLGRVIGIVFFVPLVLFAWQRKLDRRLLTHLGLLLVIGACQGYMGWFMVKSGLVDNPRVSHYRLTLHLAMAVILYTYLLFLALGQGAPRTPRLASHQRGLFRYAGAVTILVVVMILSGGLVAGTRAGFIYPTFPRMGEHWLPPEVYATTPAWLAAFEDMATIQFNHRLLAVVVFVACVALAIKVFRSGVGGRLAIAAHLMMALLLTQVTLGILTLVLHVPVSLAASHQGVAILLYTSLVYLTLASRPGRGVAP